MKKLTNVFLLFVALMMVVGCYTERKAQKQALRHQATYPAQMASDCSLWYPVKEKTVISTKYIQGDPEVTHDTLVFTDTVTQEKIREIRTIVKSVDTFYKDSTVQGEDQAKSYAKYQLLKTKDEELSKLGSKLSSVKTQRNIAAVAAASLLLLGIIGLLLKKFLPF